MAEVYGVPVDGLPPGWVATEVVVIARCLLPEDEAARTEHPYGIATRRSAGLAAWDVTGMARSAMLQADAQISGAFGRGGES